MTREVRVWVDGRQEVWTVWADAPQQGFWAFPPGTRSAVHVIAGRAKDCPAGHYVPRS